MSFSHFSQNTGGLPSRRADPFLDFILSMGLTFHAAPAGPEQVAPGKRSAAGGGGRCALSAPKRAQAKNAIFSRAPASGRGSYCPLTPGCAALAGGNLLRPRWGQYLGGAKQIQVLGSIVGLPIVSWKDT